MRSILREWRKLKDRVSERSVFLFLDYDGTLTPIVGTPEKAIISRAVRTLLHELSRSPRCTLAIISGRALKDIRNIIGLKGIIYSGNHGLEIAGPKIAFEPMAPSGYRAILERIKRDLNKKLSSINGAFVEDKGLSLSLHFRLAQKKDIPLVKTIFHETIILYLVKNKIKVKIGKMVLEARPPLEWDKGRVVLWLLARQQFISGKNALLPIYIGDDVTDEDAFKALRKKGLTIAVGGPRHSMAQYYLKDTGEVTKFLRLMLALQHK